MDARPGQRRVTFRPQNRTKRLPKYPKESPKRRHFRVSIDVDGGADTAAPLLRDDRRFILLAERFTRRVQLQVGRR